MSQHVEGPRKTFKAGTALEAFRRVKITDPATSPKTIGYAGAGDQCIGITEAYVASGADCAIYLANAQGTRKMTATAAAITGNNVVYAAADGKVAATGTVVEGKALESTPGADGDLLEVLPVGNSDISTAITGTTAATFQVDSDLGKPRAGLKSQTGGTGDYVAYYQAPATLTGNRTYTGPADADDTLVGVAAAQTLTNKTLTTPIIGSGGVRGGGVAHVHRHRVSTAEVNAGHELLPAISGYKYRIHDVALIAIGGNAATATTVDVLGTQSASGVKLLAAAVAGLTRSTVLRAGATNAAVLADGASFTECDANTAITIGKTGSDLATATHIDVLLTYETIAA